MTELITVGLVAFGAAVVLTPVTMAIARRTGIVDRPGPLKPQSVPVPLLGGLAVFLAAVVGPATSKPAFTAPLCGALVLGVADDRFDLPPWTRLVGQVAVGAAVAAVAPVRVPAPGGELLLVVVTVVLMNAVNFVDGIDSLASVVVALSGGAFCFLLHGAGRDLALAVAAALVGFLLYNRPPARVYLGDGGSYMLGTALALLVAYAWAPHQSWSKGLASLLLVAVPCAEVPFAVVRRIRERKTVVHGDRRHPYDMLVARGWGVAATAGVYAACEVVLAACALLVSRRGSPVSAVVVLVLGAAALVALGAAVGSLAPESKGRS